MKKIFKLFMYSTIALAVVASCTEKEETPAGDTPGTETPGNGDQPGEPAKPKPELEEVALTASPTGDTLTFELKALGEWTIAADDCDWITVEPASGTGDATVTFYVTPNQAGRDRSVSYYVTEAESETTAAGETYEVFISQVKQELPLLEGDYEFLKWIVDNNALGDATPTITDWYSFSPADESIVFPHISYGVDAAGKAFIQKFSYFGTGADLGYTALPPTINLQGCEDFYINCTPDGTDAATMTDWMKSTLAGSEIPTEWNCPALWRLHLECVGMQGVISPSLAALPILEQLFIRCCDVYGALPHDWASEVLGNLVIGYAGSAADCPNMGYLVPAQFDIILNSAKTTAAGERQRDKGGIHLAGAPEGWLGYENGWGQERYEKFDPNAVEGDETTWSAFRGLTEGTAEEVAAGGIRNPQGTDNAWYIDTWAWFFQRMGNQPAELHAWDQAAADEFTAAAAAKARLF